MLDIASFSGANSVALFSFGCGGFLRIGDRDVMEDEGRSKFQVRNGRDGCVVLYHYEGRCTYIFGALEGLTRNASLEGLAADRPCGMLVAV